jgi:formylglycine-generating enzyme required for sulfatase activity
LEVAGAVAVGNTANPSPPAGTIRWTGSDFEGYNGSRWVSLSSDPLAVTPQPNMVWIRPGSFAMGSPGFDVNRAANEGPQTSVTISRGFWMGIHEVTQGEYLAVTTTNPSSFTGDLRRPVESVSWNDATNYCGRLTKGERTAGHIPANWAYRLPTEAEWEYACRAGTITRFYYGDDPGYTNLTNYAWYYPYSDVMTHPVEQKAPNGWGLFDMYGNVWEWCQDWVGDYPGGSVTDPQGPNSGSYRGLRGGGWNYWNGWSLAGTCRSASRGNGYYPDDRYDYIGFRVVLAPGQ